MKISTNWSKWLLIVLGVITWCWTMVKSGLAGHYGIGFWGANGHDGIWHIALIERLSRWSLSIPIFSGHDLQNYHLGFDILLSLVHRLTGAPPVTLYFQILPPIFALCIGLLVYSFVWNYQHSQNSAWWATFFVYFGGSFAWLIGKGESAFWSQQAISTLINPPFALSLIFILLGLICLQKSQAQNSSHNAILAILFFGILIEIKVYAGLLVLGGLACVVMYEFARKRPNLATLIHINVAKIFLGSLVLSLILFFTFSRISGSLIIFQPFWFLETMMGLSDRLGWERFFSAMSNYKSGHVWVKAIPAYIVAFSIFVLGNFWTRAIFLKDIFKKPDSIKVFMLSIIAAGILIPTFFVQSGTPWNTIQFMYYSLFFSSILGGITISEIVDSSKLHTTTIRIVVVAFVLFTIPTTIITLRDVYIPNRPPAIVPDGEMFALTFLSSQPSGTVLTYPFDSYKAKEAEANPPRPLYLYTSTAYVSAFSGQPTFLEDEINLDILGYDWKTRRSDVESWYKEPNQSLAREFLKKNNIKYVYWLKGQRAYLGEGQLGLKNMFENNQVIIYQVN